MFALRLIGVLALVALNGFFAATEFSLVAVRLSRVRQLVQKGDARAKVVEVLLSDLHRVVSGVQLGITLASLALGALGENTLANLLQTLWPKTEGARAALIAHAVALAGAFAMLSAVHVVIGELVPKTVSLARAERVALLIAPEELQIQIQQARERGLIAPGEEKFIVSAIELGQVQVREIMVPRPDMHVLPVESTLDEVMRVFATTQRSRIPVYRGTEDQILGFVHIKDMLWVLLDRERRLEEGVAASAFDLRRVLREILIVPETKPASELLAELRTRRVGMALVVDEFGSILGLVTVEDILEQVVGEIHDEFDVVERPLTLADGAVIFDAALNVRDLDTQYNITLPEDPAYATVGGFVLDQLGFIPRGGESFEYGNYRFTVVEMDGKRVARVKVERIHALSDAQKGAASAADVAAAPATPASVALDAIKSRSGSSARTR